jgi:pilus assembly protein CpaB
MSLEEAKRFIDAMNFARSVRILKAPQQKDEKKVSVNQEVPDKVEDPDQQKQGEQSPTNGEGNNSLPSNLDEQQLDLD